ncbi:MAG: hypothetical protein HZB46_04665, partial [Solirubrobacterales bacterium]|nr:hypothetical protein [Solirubrobacterales bacterium]
MRPSARRPRARAALALAVAALALAAGPARAAVTVGLSDASPYMVGDHRFAALGVRHVRLVVPWDAARTERAALDLYVKNATVFGADVHVAFEHARDDRCPGSPCTLPSVAEYGDAVAAFRARYPQVTTFTAWNEANHVTQPTRTAPAQAARYFAALRARCAGCTVVAGDVLAGQPGLGAWLDAFRAEAGPGPLLWGVHDYGDANRGGSDELDAFLGMVDGEVWITETGGIVRFATEDGRVTMPYDEGRAAQAVAYALDLADARAPRVTRAYLHSFTGGGRMDTGLVGTDGRTRPGYDALLAHLRAAGVPPSPPPWEVTNEPPPLAAMVDPAPAPDAVVAMPVPRGGALAL